ncbi:hypothetical protein [Loigolactobacillus zhaoyuanensis]|uniref:hypothetical protein n=1 Tax=Loigolactobacillus zhaoyuanensis TaxID=2486017 RepID=UPI003633F1AE
MIPEDVRNRITSYYFLNSIEESFENKLVDRLTMAMLQSNEQISENELVDIGIKLIKEYLEQ